MGAALAVENDDPRSELEAIRSQLDSLDQQLIGILAERFQVGERAARIKSRMGIPIHDAAREEHVLSQARDWARTAGLPESDVADLFMRMMSLSRAAQISATAEHRPNQN